MVKKLIYQFKNSTFSGKVYEVKPKIFAVIIKNDYDRAMMFYRYQEYYESPYKEIKGKYFSLHEFIKLYMHKRKVNVFKYHNDWSGFNLPSQIIESAIPVFENDNDIYNEVFRKVYEMCKKYVLENYGEKSKFYLIGIDKCIGRIMKHEIAHGLFYVNDEYKSKMLELIKTIKINVVNNMKKNLIKLGYDNNQDILLDEIQAYVSTNDYKQIDTTSLSTNYYQFMKTFNHFYKTK